METQKKKGISAFQTGLIWFGAAVSVAEIQTGTFLAPLGFARGMAAVLLGHLIGGVLFFLAGLIGARTRQSGMETVKNSFGQNGARFFSVLNILQLLGWTAVMIYDGASAAGNIMNTDKYIWCIAIGALILFWIWLGPENSAKFNTAAMGLLFVLTLVLSRRVFGSGGAAPAAGAGTLGFGEAVELSATMPLSWLPLVSDYTREAEKPVKASVTAAVVYTLGSCWMYAVGLGAALFAGESDLAALIRKAGPGIAGLLIVLFSTVTTTCLDAYSAGVSSETVHPKPGTKAVAAAAAILGTAGALFLPLHDFTPFLYAVGSVFAPMAAVLITDRFVLRQSFEDRKISVKNFVLWAAGFVLYRVLLTVGSPVGSTLPVMAATALLCVVVRLSENACRKRRAKKAAA